VFKAKAQLLTSGYINTQIIALREIKASRSKEVRKIPFDFYRIAMSDYHGENPLH